MIELFKTKDFPNILVFNAHDETELSSIEDKIK